MLFLNIKSLRFLLFKLFTLGVFVSDFSLPSFSFSHMVSSGVYVEFSLNEECRFFLYEIRFSLTCLLLV